MTAARPEQLNSGADICAVFESSLADGCLGGFKGKLWLT